MRMAVIETSSRTGGVGLAEDGQVVAEREVLGGVPRGNDLVCALDAATREIGWSAREIELLALSIGPGSFTGLRIAVMFARAFAWQTGARIVTAATLRAIAENAPREEPLVGVVTDAQRGGVYWAAYARGSDGSLARTAAECVGEAEEAARQLAAEAFLMGDGLNRGGAFFAGRRQAGAALWAPRLAVVAALGWARHLSGEHAAPETLEPLYVRRPAPEEVWERRRRGGR